MCGGGERTRIVMDWPLLFDAYPRYRRFPFAALINRLILPE